MVVIGPCIAGDVGRTMILAWPFAVAGVALIVRRKPPSAAAFAVLAGAQIALPASVIMWGWVPLPDLPIGWRLGD